MFFSIGNRIANLNHDDIFFCQWNLHKVSRFRSKLWWSYELYESWKEKVVHVQWGTALAPLCSLYYVSETIKELTYKQIQIQTLSILASIQIIRRNGPFSKEFCLLTSQKESPFVDPALLYCWQGEAYVKL